MSYWNGKSIIHIPPSPYSVDGEMWPNWWRVDCGCCAGIRWGGEEPVECGYCGGGGFIALHEPSGLLAAWPGGPIVAGKLNTTEIKRELNLAMFPGRLLTDEVTHGSLG